MGQAVADVQGDVGPGVGCRGGRAFGIYQLLLGTPEAAEATGQIGTFLRARVR